MLIVALPGRCADARSAPRRFVSILAALVVTFQLLTRLAAGVRVFLVVAVRLAALLAPRRVLIAVLASCTFAL